MRALLLILAGLLLLAAGLFFVLGQPAATPAPGAASEQELASPAAPAAAALSEAPASGTPTERGENRTGVLVLRARMGSGASPAQARFLIGHESSAEWRDGNGPTTAVARAGQHELAAALADGHWSLPAVLSAETRQTNAEVVLDAVLPAAVLELRIHGRDGEPVPQAAVQFAFADVVAGMAPEGRQLGLLYARARAGEPPAARYDDLPAGVWSVTVSAPRAAPTVQSIRLEPGASGRLDFLLAPGAFVLGAVLDEDGAAIADAELHVVPDQLGALESLFGGALDASRDEILIESTVAGGAAHAGPDGRFRVGPLAPGTLRLAARAPGFRTGWSPDNFTLAGGEERELAPLVLRRGLRLRVQAVAAEDGQPLAKAQVRYRSGAGDQSAFLGSWPWAAMEPVLTDEAGIAPLENLAPGPLSVQIAAAGRATKEVQVQVTENAREQLEVVALAAGLGIRGRVLDAATRQPVAGAKVGAVQADGTNWLEEMMPAARGTSTASTAEDGSFALADLRPGEWTVRVEAEGYAVGSAGPHRVAATELEPYAEVLLTRGGNLRALVLDGEGQPKPGAIVSVFNFSAGSPDGKQTGADGVALFEHLAAGSYTVSAMNLDQEGQALALLAGDFNGLETQMLAAAIEEGATTEVVLGGPVLRSTVSGFVSCAGEPVAELAVLLVSGATFQAGSTDDAGYYEIEDVPAGEYMFMAGQMQLGGGAGYSSTVSVPGSRPVRKDVDLPAGGLLVRVVQASDNSPAGAVYVVVRPKSGAMDLDMLSTNAQGEVRFPFLAPGEYYVSAGRATMAFGFGGGADLASITHGPVRVGSSEERLELRLDAAATVRARVLDGRGQPVRGAGLFYFDASGQPLSLFNFGGSSGDGWVELRSLPSGPGAIEARHPQLGLARMPVRLNPGESQEIELRLQSATVLKVLPVDKDGSPLKGVQVIALDEAGTPVPFVFGAEEMMTSWTAFLQGGEQRIGPLRGGRYQLLLMRPGGSMTVEWVDVGEGAPEMRLRPVYDP